MNKEIVKILRDIENSKFHMETAESKLELLDIAKKEDSSIRLKDNNGAGIEIFLGKEETRIVFKELESHLLAVADANEKKIKHLLRKLKNMDI